MPILCCVFESHSQAAATDPVKAIERDTLVDKDGDGLDDSLEFGQHSSEVFVDTDTDGWNDAEELARGSLSTAYVSQPGNQPISIGASAYMRAGRLHVALATYIRSGTLANASLNVGLAANRRMLALSPTMYATNATITTVPTKDPGELVMITDIIVTHGPLIRTGSMSIYATLSVGELQSATAINLVMQSGTPMALISTAQLSPLAEVLLGPGIIHRPLGGSPVPIELTPGEVCFQRLESVGTHGALVTQEVTTSSCVSGWDGYCDAGACATSVGTTVDLVDPAALIGG